MEWLYDFMDLPENLQRGLYVCRPIRGLSAFIMATVLLALCWLLWPWLWYFDIESTQVWTQQGLASLQPTLSNVGIPLGEMYRENVAWIITGTTFLPTIIELFTVRFASGGIKAARTLVMFFATFDLVTDWPRVSAFVDSFDVDIGIFAAPILFLLKVGLLLLASFGLQMLFIVFGLCSLALLLNARMVPVGRTHPSAARPGTIDV